MKNKSNIVFVASGFIEENFRLQPWRYIYEIAKHISEKYNVVIISNGNSEFEEKYIEDGRIKIVYTSALRIGSQSRLYEIVNEIQPKVLWWSTTQRSFVYYRLLSRLQTKVILFLTGPIYQWADLLNAKKNGVPMSQLGIYIKQRLVPNIFFRKFLQARAVSKIIVMSNSNLAALAKIGIHETEVQKLSVGIDRDAEDVAYSALKEVSKYYDNKAYFTYLYMGHIRAIRGFEALVKAFILVAKSNRSCKLMVLARDIDEHGCKSIEERFRLAGVADQVNILGGWQSRAQINAHIELCDSVVLPFILVPSDVPIAALEALAKGKPIVVSDIDGLPELASGRGLVISDTADVGKFSFELEKFTRDRLKLTDLGLAANKFMESYPIWSEIGSLAIRITEE